MKGHVHPDFAGVASVFDRQLRRQRVGGGSVCVYHRGEKVVDIWGGDRNAAGDAWEKDTMAVCFSTTKGITATALHVLADRGLVDYEAPVADYWPEFAQAGKHTITVRQVASHQSGLHRLRSLIDDARQMADWDFMVSRLAESAPAYKPGTRHGYHGVTFGWTVGEIVRRVSGRSLGDFVRDEIADPLSVKGLHIGVPSSERHRVAQLTRLSFLRSPRLHQAGLRSSSFRELVDTLVPKGMFEFFDSDQVLDAELGAAGGVFDAESLARMYAALSNGGSLDRTRLMSRATIDAASEVQVRGRDFALGFPFPKRLGYVDTPTTAGLHKRAFGHWGFGGSGAWADPERELAVGYVVNRLSWGSDQFGRIMRVGGAAVRCADRRETGRLAIS